MATQFNLLSMIIGRSKSDFLIGALSKEEIRSALVKPSVNQRIQRNAF